MQALQLKKKNRQQHKTKRIEQTSDIRNAARWRQREKEDKTTKQMAIISRWNPKGDGGKGRRRDDTLGHFTTIEDNLRQFATSCDTLRHFMTTSIAFFTWNKTSQNVMKRHKMSYDTLQQFIANDVPSPSSRPLLDFTGQVFKKKMKIQESNR